MAGAYTYTEAHKMSGIIIQKIFLSIIFSGFEAKVAILRSVDCQEGERGLILLGNEEVNENGL